MLKSVLSVEKRVGKADLIIYILVLSLTGVAQSVESSTLYIDSLCCTSISCRRSSSSLISDSKSEITVSWILSSRYSSFFWLVTVDTSVSVFAHSSADSSTV